jgi:hypothetical protein
MQYNLQTTITETVRQKIEKAKTKKLRMLINDSICEIVIASIHDPILWYFVASAF